MRGAPDSAIASRTLRVPPMLTSGLFRAQARCATASAPATQRSTAAALRTSASTNSAALGQLSGRWRARPMTSWPWLSNRAARPRPSTPLAPVTAILTDWPGSFGAAFPRKREVPPPHRCALHRRRRESSLVVVQQRRVDQVVEVHVREVFFGGDGRGCRLSLTCTAVTLVCQREQ